MRGHYGYYGIIGNFYCLQEFREAARGIWRRWRCLGARRGKPMPWSRFSRLREEQIRVFPAVRSSPSELR